jgi:holin-like protein
LNSHVRRFQVIEGFALLLVFQLVGEAASRALGLPVPGPVIGLALLFAALRLNPGRKGLVTAAAEALHSHFSLLFVPAGVGVMLYVPLLAREWVAIVLSVVVSTLVGLVVTAWVANALIQRQEGLE